MTKLGFLRLSYEKQDTLLKLLILSMAAVLCESTPSYTQCVAFLMLYTHWTHWSMSLSFPLQPSPPDSFPSWGLKVSSMSSIRKCFSCHGYSQALLKDLAPQSNASPLAFISPSGTSTTVRPASWQKKDFISSTTGLMTGHGILSGGSLVAPFIQVGVREKYLESCTRRWVWGYKKGDVSVLHVYSPPSSALMHLLSRLPLFSLLTGLMITSAVLYHVLHFFHITIDIRNVCVFLAPLFSSFTAIVTYHFTKELKVKHIIWYKTNSM